MNMAIETMISESFLEVDVSQGGGLGSRRNISGTFLQTKSRNESFLN